MAVSHKDLALLNSRIWLANLIEVDIDRGLDFPTVFFYVPLNHLWKCQKAWWPKKSKEDKQISAGLN